MKTNYSFFNWGLGKKITLLKYNKRTVKVYLDREWKELKVRDIEFLESDGSYCIIHFVNQKPVVSSLGLAYYSKQLPVNFFGKYHRSFVFNRWFVENFITGKTWTATMKSGHQLPVSDKLETEFKEDYFEFQKLKKNVEE